MKKFWRKNEVLPIICHTLEEERVLEAITSIRWYRKLELAKYFRVSGTGVPRGGGGGQKGQTALGQRSFNT